MITQQQYPLYMGGDDANTIFTTISTDSSSNIYVGGTSESPTFLETIAPLPVTGKFT